MILRKHQAEFDQKRAPGGFTTSDKEETMMGSFNKLTPAETERLSILMEEMSEASQVIGKILRFGYQNYHPSVSAKSNRTLLAEEIGHVRYIVGEMCQRGDISEFIMQASAEDKGKKINKYLRHNRFGEDPGRGGDDELPVRVLRRRS